MTTTYYYLLLLSYHDAYWYTKIKECQGYRNHLSDVNFLVTRRV